MGRICNVVSALQQRLPDFCVECDRNFADALYIKICKYIYEHQADKIPRLTSET